MLQYCLLVAFLGLSSANYATLKTPVNRVVLTSPATDTLPQVFVPVLVCTPKLTISGGGTVIIPPPFTPVLVRTPLLTISGGGTVITPKPFTPVTVVTPKLTISGKTVN